jgi:hypothetical protein
MMTKKKEKKFCKLSDISGFYKLSGVSRESDNDGETIWFRLNNRTYVATEDPEDGYRSCLGSIEIVNVLPKFTFLPIEVKCVYVSSTDREVVEVYDVKTNKMILEVGTHNIDDYYPGFVASWDPQNMALNSIDEALLAIKNEIGLPE